MSSSASIGRQSWQSDSAWLGRPSVMASAALLDSMLTKGKKTLSLVNRMTSPTDTSDTLREWRDSAPFWANHSATIRIMFAPLTEALIEDTQIEKGHSVLDVAGGPGEPSLTIAQTVGDTGSVTCTDAVAEMVEAAEAEARGRGVTN